MRNIAILHDILRKNCPQVHALRLDSLMLATEILLNSNQLSLTEPGRNMKDPVAAKHNIKRMDRLLGNTAMHNDLLAIYRFHTRLTCGANPMPILLVDWADCARTTAVDDSACFRQNSGTFNDSVLRLGVFVFLFFCFLVGQRLTVPQNIKQLLFELKLLIRKA
ncbi:hypothetical protein J5X90_15935 [Pseudoalteromonas viridis]|uniref:Uncharacterized protein n=1 Tax=Pseudoalteromonas viridis TaxID=339617 RepID=A0ABX7V5F7_9GAMM|nr:hypothetical protein J5X90_15935 [Pseudoalteromonas viridis]